MCIYGFCFFFSVCKWGGVITEVSVGGFILYLNAELNLRNISVVYLKVVKLRCRSRCEFILSFKTCRF